MERREWTTQEKQAVVLDGLRGTGTVVDLCRKHGITQEEYYRWRDRFVAGGRRALGRLGDDPHEEHVDE